MKMKKFAAFLGAAAAALMMASAAQAQTGFVGASYTSNDDLDLDTAAISGSVALGANVQLDGRYANIDDADLDEWRLGGHLFSRGQQWLWGVYAGWGTLDGSGGDIDEWTIAGETQYYLNRTTLSGALSYTDAEFITDLEQLALDGEVRHFVSDNFSIQGNAAFGNIDASGGGDADFWGAGIGAEFQFASAPISIYGGWQHFDLDGGPESDSIGAGVRWNFGGGSLFDRNRSGAGLSRPAGFFERFFGEFSPR
jgi:hypothetical protein